MLLPFALVSDDVEVNAAAFSAAVAYILIYAVMNLGAFAVTTAVSRRHPRLLVEDFSGLARTAPVLAVGMIACMVSLAGVPPTGGFWGKLLIFQAAIERGDLGVWLASIMVINSVISIGYYFTILRVIPQDAADTEALDTSWLVTTVVALLAVGLVVIFILPNAIAHLGDVAVLGTGT